MVVPQNGWFMRENPDLKWMIWGYSHFRKLPNECQAFFWTQWIPNASHYWDPSWSPKIFDHSKWIVELIFNHQTIMVPWCSIICFTLFLPNKTKLLLLFLFFVPQIMYIYIYIYIYSNSKIEMLDAWKLCGESHRTWKRNSLSVWGLYEYLSKAHSLSTSGWFYYCMLICTDIYVKVAHHS